MQQHHPAASKRLGVLHLTTHTVFVTHYGYSSHYCIRILLDIIEQNIRHRIHTVDIQLYGCMNIEHIESIEHRTYGCMKYEYTYL